MESHLEGAHVSHVHRDEHAVVRGSIALAGARVQRNAASQHRHGPVSSDTRQRTHRVGPFVCATIAAAETSHPQSGRSGAVEQETSPVQERVFARLDRRSVFCATRGGWLSAHVQVARMGRHPPEEDLLPRGCAKSARARRRAVSGGEGGASTGSQRVGALERMAR